MDVLGLGVFIAQLPIAAAILWTIAIRTHRPASYALFGLLGFPGLLIGLGLMLSWHPYRTN